MSRRIFAILSASALLTACPAGGNGVSPKQASPSPVPSPRPAVSPSQGLTSPPAVQGAYTGVVLGTDGQPAAGVVVRGFLISEGAGMIISNNSGNLISANGGKFRVSQAGAGLQTTTDASGRFSLADPQGRPLNIEAVKSDELKAIALSVAATTRDLTLQLKPTGAIAGKVTSKDPGITEFEGVDIFIPGTSYSAKAAKDGSFTISNVPVGSFEVVALKTGQGRASAPDTKVESRQTTTVTNLVLSVNGPLLNEVGPANGGPGASITLKGENFGKTTGENLLVTAGGAVATDVERVDNNTIRFKVPANAVTGKVQISVSGNTSNGLPFTVLKSLTLSPQRTYLTLGTKTPFTVAGLDTAEVAVPAPAVSWAVEGEAVTVQDGVVEAVKPGDGVLIASSGDVKTRLPLKVTNGGVVLGNVSTLAGEVQGNADGKGSQARFHTPRAVAVDAAGNVIVGDYNNHLLRKVTPDGTVTTFSKSPRILTPVSLALTPQGGFVAVGYDHQRVFSVTSEGVPSLLAGEPLSDFATSGYVDGTGTAARFAYPSGCAVDQDGMAYVADVNNNCIRRVTAAGEVTTFAGSTNQGSADGPAKQATFNHPWGLAIDPGVALYVADQGNNRIRRISLTDPAHTVSTLTDKVFGPTNMALAADGALFFTEQEFGRIKRVTNDGTVTTIAGEAGLGFADGPVAQARFNHPYGLTFDKEGNLYVADSSNHRIRKLTP